MSTIIKAFDIHLTCNTRAMSLRSKGFVKRLCQVAEKDLHRFCENPNRANVSLTIQELSDNQLHLSIRSTDNHLYPAQVDLYRQSLKTIGLGEKTNRRLAGEKDLVRKIILLCAIAASATSNQ